MSSYQIPYSNPYKPFDGSQIKYGEYQCRTCRAYDEKMCVQAVSGQACDHCARKKLPCSFERNARLQQFYGPTSHQMGGNHPGMAQNQHAQAMTPHTSAWGNQATLHPTNPGGYPATTAQLQPHGLIQSGPHHTEYYGATSLQQPAWPGQNVQQAPIGQGLSPSGFFDQYDHERRDGEIQSRETETVDPNWSPNTDPSFAQSMYDAQMTPPYDGMRELDEAADQAWNRTRGW